MAKRNSVSIRLTPTQRRALGKLTGLQHGELRFEGMRTSRGYSGVVVLTSRTTPRTTRPITPGSKGII